MTQQAPYFFCSSCLHAIPEKKVLMKTGVNTDNAHLGWPWKYNLTASRISLPTSNDGRQIFRSIENTTAWMVSLLGILKHDLHIFFCIAFTLVADFKNHSKNLICTIYRIICQTISKLIYKIKRFGLFLVLLLDF